MSRPALRGRKAAAKTLRAARTADPQKSVLPMSADGRACRSVQAPRYDRERRELRVGAVLVKRFTQRSDAQEIILQAFQEENWQAIIDDPLPGKQGQDPKRRLATAVANLNRRQRAALLYFGVTRLGTGVEWRFREASDREATGKRQ